VCCCWLGGLVLEGRTCVCSRCCWSGWQEGGKAAVFAGANQPTNPPSSSMISNLSAPSCAAPAGGEQQEGFSTSCVCPRLSRPAACCVLATAAYLMLLLLVGRHRHSDACLQQGWQPLMRAGWESCLWSSTSLLLRGSKAPRTPWKSCSVSSTI
jgi:hypothetical protein